MNIALIGASGFVGSAVLKELVYRGHQVTAITRHPEKISGNASVKPVKADAMEPDQIAEAVKGQDAVISTFNAGWDNPNIYQDFLKGSKSIQEGVKKAGVKRLITVGGAGSLYVAEGVQLVDSPDFPEAWKAGALSARDYLDELRKEKDLEWTFLSPAIEMNQGTAGVRTGSYRTGLENPVFNEQGKSVISVEDIAVALADEVEHPKHIRQRFTVAW